MTGEWIVELRTLRYFVCVAEEKSFTRAANRLRIAQPALSRQIKKLEDDLKVQLFVRSARGAEVTEAGEILLRRAYLIFNQVQQTHHDVTIHASRPAGVVSVGMPPTPGEFIAPRLLERAKERYPEIELRFVEGFSGALEQKLNNNEIGVAVMHDPKPRDEIRISELLVENLCLVGKTGTLDEADYTLAEASSYPLIMPSRPNFLRILVDTHAEENDISLNIVTRSDGIGHTKSLVKYGHGFTILTYGAIISEVQQGVLEAAPIREPEIKWSLCVAMRTDQSKKKTLTVIEELIREVVVELTETGIWR
ncbi:LysR family transcriptional regulator [Roseibium limicola]|uniref:LysR family transcriptional regulator n=1 Tax=Roseibium limicola TaxID=2816037 RepID=A0A939ES18_9HYPH|nr:LysR family transcriptional regulator [Roseibium limicola]MBO0347443.1 LysR family transcriptional regulator [Roseibium limicola]